MGHDVWCQAEHYGFDEENEEADGVNSVLCISVVQLAMQNIQAFRR